jgi:hypothetical protein
VTPLLKTIPVLFEKSDLLEFTFGAEPIIKLIAWEAVTLEIDFVGAAANFFVTRRVICRSIRCVRLNETCVMLQSHTSFAFQCHARALPFRSPNEIVSSRTRLSDEASGRENHRGR